MCRILCTEILPLFFGSTYPCNFGQGPELSNGAAVIQPLTQAPDVSHFDDSVGCLGWKEHGEKREVMLLEMEPLSMGTEDRVGTRRQLCTVPLPPVNRAQPVGFW